MSTLSVRRAIGTGAAVGVRPRFRPAAWVIAGATIFIPFMLIQLLDSLTRTPLPEGLIKVEWARRLVTTDSALPPLTDSRWIRVRLPDDATGSRNHGGAGWYHVELDPGRFAPELWSIYLQRPNSAIAIHANGVLAADSGVHQRPLPAYRFDLKFDLPRPMLRAAHNDVLVRVVRERDPISLGNVWFGDSAALARYQAERSRIEQSWVRAILVMIVVFGLVHAAFYFARPRDTYYGWFAAALLMWAIHTWINQQNQPLLGWIELSRPLGYVTLGWFVIFGLLFVHRFLHIRAVLAERTAWVFGVLGSSVLLWRSIGGHTDFRDFGDSAWVPGILVLGAYMVCVLIRSAVRLRNSDVSALGSVAATLLAVGTRDYLFDCGWIAGGSIHYLPYAAPLTLLVFGALLLRRYISALNQAESLNRDLEGRVAEKTAAIEASWRRASEIERERARLEERDRLMRDMHDGIGGQLVEALTIARKSRDSNRVPEIIDACLIDLRLIIDSTDPTTDSLNDALAQFRQHSERRLLASGVVLDWPWDRMPALPSLPPHHTLQVLRSLQELLTNVIKHSHARRVSIDCQRHRGQDQPGTIQITVVDDGVGFNPSGTGCGRGLSNLRRRARDIGATIRFESAAAGTRATLAIPIGNPS